MNKQPALAPPAITGTAETGQGQITVGAGKWSIEGTDELAVAITRGRASVNGQRKAADPQLAARRKLACQLYAEYFANDPSVAHSIRSAMVSEDLADNGIDVAPKRVAKWIPNPHPTNRGRRSKKK